MRKVRWGILSTARIGTEKVIPALQHSRYGEVVALASRRIEQARAAANTLGIPNVYGSYEQLLADPAIDAIYNPLPNHLHVPWSIRALHAGKHVLCEKPIALSAAEAQELAEAAQQHPQLKLMEAFMYRHHPQWQRTRQLVVEGGIGDLRTIHSFFSYHNTNPSDIRNQAAIGGGGMLDIGCYTISQSRFIFNAEPRQVFGVVEYDPQLQIDRLASGILDFGSGTATFTCSTQLAAYQRVQIFGTAGRIELEVPFTPPSDRQARMWYQHGDSTEEIVFAACDQYALQCDRFAEAILNDSAVPTPIEDAVANMRVIEAVVRSAESGSWVATTGRSPGSGTRDQEGGADT